MDETKAQILKAKTAGEVLRWMKRQPQIDSEVSAYFNLLAKREFEERNPGLDPDMHRDFSEKD